eukprot:6625327-Pyramimonas_sp.AAC.1
MPAEDGDRQEADAHISAGALARAPCERQRWPGSARAGRRLPAPRATAPPSRPSHTVPGAR